MTNADSQEFNRLYCQLTDIEKERFKNITNKLLQVNFLLKEHLKDAYLFVLTRSDLFILFFRYLNFDFIVRKDKELVYIKSETERLSKNLTKNETLCILVLRLLYQHKYEEVTLADDIEITVKELQDQLFAVGFAEGTSDRVRKSTLNDMLKVFKRYNIVSYEEKKIAFDDTIITIYPSIEVAVDFKTLTEVTSRLESLKGGEDNNE